MEIGICFVKIYFGIFFGQFFKGEEVAGTMTELLEGY